MVQGWYQGGVSVFDFTDSAKPVEIAYFDRGPIDGSQLVTGGFWSAYWNNGYIYASEISRGIDVFRLTPSAFLSKDELEAAALVHTDELNVQQQARIAWPARAVVARAYLDQLGRTSGLAPARAGEVRSLAERLDRLRSRRDRGAAALLMQAEREAAQLDGDAAAAPGADGRRLRALAQTLRGHGRAGAVDALRRPARAARRCSVIASVTVWSPSDTNRCPPDTEIAIDTRRSSSAPSASISAPVERADRNLVAAMNPGAGQLPEQLPRVAVRVDGDAARQLHAAVQPVRIRHPDFDPGRRPAREIAHEQRRLVARRHALGQLDAFLELQAVGQHPHHHVLDGFGRVPRNAQAQRFEHAAVHVGEVDGEGVDRRRQRHGRILRA